jgi:hypothetical protein
MYAYVRSQARTLTARWAAINVRARLSEPLTNALVLPADSVLFPMPPKHTGRLAWGDGGCWLSILDYSVQIIGERQVLSTCSTHTRTSPSQPDLHVFSPLLSDDFQPPLRPKGLTSGCAVSRSLPKPSPAQPLPFFLFFYKPRY